MPTTNPLRIAVADLLAKPGAVEPYEETVVFDDLRTALARVEGEISIVATLEAIDAESVHVKGLVRTTASVSCRRCLTPAHTEVKGELDEIFRPLDDVIDPELVVDVDEFIDLTSPVRDAVVLALPEFPVCREDCKGLCSNCGADLNKGDCDCPKSQPDPRWAVLENLKDNL